MNRSMVIFAVQVVAIRTTFLVVAYTGTSNQIDAQSVARERPAEWEQLVFGGQFKDRLQPVPIIGELTETAGATGQVWGGRNVVPRDVLNGIEDPRWSYWGGDPFIAADGKFHLYVCRWPENDERGHMAYNDSIVVHAVSEKSLGPYRVVDEVGPGHNPDFFQLADGRFAVHVFNGQDGDLYISENLSGPWKKTAYNLDAGGRNQPSRIVNDTFLRREDGAILKLYRRGLLWLSQTGLSNYYQINEQSIYPPYEGKYEDPLIWRTDVQYHLIVNDWLGRIAYHLRSKDGFHWKTEPGEAYTPGIDRYEDGTSVDWYKLERIRVLQDKYGRVMQAHFAVIDSEKRADLPGDNHNSKNICIPLVKGRLLSILDRQPIDAKTQTIRLLVKAEPGFDPHVDIDLDTLRFGASDEVNFGRGSKLLRSVHSGADLILTFDGSGHGFTEDNFAGKLLGKTTDGELLFGWCRLPGVDYAAPFLSARSPKFLATDRGIDLEVDILNLGQSASKKSVVHVLISAEGREHEIATGSVAALEPFATTRIRLACSYAFQAGTAYSVTVKLDCDGQKSESSTHELRLPRPSGRTSDDSE